ncbi:hypothetical protein ABZ313_23840 [Streptomyces sp. NPDC006251]|uniref:hypothetical protein n=1 Tax=Streptomyces sp. NPDC006251 TaxID=3155718 RepID=UPI0033B56C48
MRSEPSVHGGGSRRPALAHAVARGILWSVLAMSLAGTVVTAVYLPAPWGRLVVVPAALGAVIAVGLALFHITVGVTGGLTAVGEAARRLRGSDGHAGPRDVAKP